MGNKGWGYEEVLPAFRDIENYQGPRSPERGDRGPIWVVDQPDRYALDEAFIEAALQSGATRNEDFNRGSTEGVGFYQINTKNGRRCSTATACLRPALNRKNLVVSSRSRTTRILFRDKEAVGVEFLRGGGKQSVRATREVILAAGAYGSPQLLQLSGVGPRDLLKGHGIDPIHVLPGVGENFQNHYHLTLSYRCDEAGSLNESLRSVRGRLGMAWKYATRRRGPLATNATHVALHMCSSDEVTWPDIKLTMSLFSRKGMNLANVRKDLHPFPGFSVQVHHLRPDFRGSVRIGSADPTAAPVIHLGFSATPGFSRAMAAGVRRLRHMMKAPAMAALATEELEPTRNCHTDEQLLEAFRATAGNAAHPVGTCKMGVDEAAVVDSRLKVHGLERLRVIDASVMPAMVAANTHATTVMIAERGARFILGEENLP
jgi:choline dehydrogenase